MFSPFVRDSTSKSSYLKTDNNSSRPPCFIFTVSWGVVFWLRLPFVMGLTMNMPIREEKQHCEKTFNTHTYIEEPPANRGTDPSFQSAVWRLSLEVCLFCFDSSQLTVGNFPAKKSSKVKSFQKHITGMSSVLRLGFPQQILITSVSGPFHGMRWEQRGALKSCSVISCGITSCRGRAVLSAVSRSPSGKMKKKKRKINKYYEMEQAIPKNACRRRLLAV